jgi:beta-phosphoglucomutase-like phosphatase (HAD superfamily)
MKESFEQPSQSEVPRFGHEDLDRLMERRDIRDEDFAFIQKILDEVCKEIVLEHHNAFSGKLQWAQDRMIQEFEKQKALYANKEGWREQERTKWLDAMIEIIRSYDVPTAYNVNSVLESLPNQLFKLGYSTGLRSALKK